MRSSDHQNLVAAIEQGNLASIEQLVTSGVDVNQRGNDPDGQTPLMLAAGLGQESVVQLLLAAGAVPDLGGTMSGQTPLMLALDHPEVLQTLLVAGAKTELRTSSRPSGFGGGQTALHLAAGANNVVALEILIGAGAALDVGDDRGSTPLDLALVAGSPNLAAATLIAAGAELTPERRARMYSGAEPAYLRPQEMLAVTRRRAPTSETAVEIPRETPSEDFLALFVDNGVSRWAAGLKVMALISVAVPLLVILDYVTAKRKGGLPWTPSVLEIVLVVGAVICLLVIWKRIRRDKPQN